ncbi:probable apyrase 6 isoform X2 [Elaeis guineensis]|uniref:Probable apyrase 6 isoform X2 n=1 Tax=Elaeis guineensis var. tenera TaxID=51953 RepID=A0A6I9RGL0_ELAGV|nr:probable apyrase 6 isoform X2 [Elaeis guineensis]
MDFSSLQSRVSFSSSSSSSYFPPHRTQLHPRMHYAAPPASLRPPSPSRSERCWLLAAGLLILPFLFYLFAVARRAHTSARFDGPRPKGFGLVIDAGPAGSRIHVFEFLNEGGIPIVGLDGKGSVSMKVRPGLREFAADPEGAGDSLQELLEFAKGRIPRAEWKATKISLIDTGGVGGLKLEVSSAIMKSSRRALTASGFMFRDEWASSITGQDKGIYAWVAANYVLGTLGANPQETMGIIQLGGGSAQVAFVPKEPPPMEFSRMLRLPGVTYNLYSKSIHHFGQDVAWESLIKLHSSGSLRSSSDSIEAVMSACIPKGYNETLNPKKSSDALKKAIFTVDSVGNFSACRSKASVLLQGQGTCSHPPCNILPRLFPELQGTPIAIHNFFYISELFGMAPRASLLNVEAAGRHYCEDPWVRLKEEHFGIDEMDLFKYCFSSAYIVALLHDGLGIPMDVKRIGFADPIVSAPFDWTLGAFILHTVVEPELETEIVTQIVGNDAITYIELFAILFMAILAALFLSNWRKPRFKTVYDLEKGHYIVTRVPR